MWIVEVYLERVKGSEKFSDVKTYFCPNILKGKRPDLQYYRCLALKETTLEFKGFDVSVVKTKVNYQMQFEFD